MKVIGTQTKDMDLDMSDLQMEISIKESIIKEKLTEKESSTGNQGQCMMENG